MRIQAAGITILESFEGLRLATYRDEAGKRTIGWGHLLTGNETYPHGINLEEAERLLQSDTMAAERAVSRALSWAVNQNQFDAMVCLTFNIGGKAFAGSSVCRFANARDFVFAADAFARWNKVTVDGVKQISDGLTRRRAAERALFLAPVLPYSTDALREAVVLNQRPDHLQPGYVRPWVGTGESK